LGAALALFSTTQSYATGASGTDHGFYWAWWVNTGSASMTFPGAGTYPGIWHLSWSNIGDGGGGKGWNPGSNTRNVNYNSSDPYYQNYGAYGWAPYPTYEMYIQDRSDSQSGGSSTYKGSINSDGGTYKVYLGTQATYSGGGKQYVSKRTSNTTGGANYTITTNNHMSWWASHGMSHGTWQDWKLNVEAYGSNISGYSGGNVW
jgi:endo-1,4-beta-xylanase